MSKVSLLLSCLLFGISTLPALALEAPTADETAVRQAITDARDKNGPFDLEVFCTNNQARRALYIFPDGVAVWNHSLQLRLPQALRAGMLDLLLTHDFPSFLPRYGETEESDRMDEAFRVSCRVSLTVEGLTKVSEQFYDGPQEKRLLELAKALLDRVQPLEIRGTGAADLADGLAKLASGELDPKLLNLRYVTLPASKDQPGNIFRINATRISRQRYTPGENIGAVEWTSLSSCDYQKLMRAIEAADIPVMPVNLWSNDHIELEVQVLDHRKSIVAQPFTRLRESRSSQAQVRFAALLTELDKLDEGSGCSPDQ
jgi:hypothetical protein